MPETTPQTAVPHSDIEPRVTTTVAARIGATHKWVRIVAIAMTAFVAVLLAGSVISIAVGMSASARAPLIYVGIGLAIATLVYILPVIALHRYIRAMHALQVHKTLFSFERTAAAGRTFWRTAGVVASIILFANVYSVTKSSLIPNYRAAVRKAKQRRTLSDIKSIGLALERYAQEHHRYPNAQSISALAHTLEPRYIQKLPVADGWGRPLRYVTLCDDGWCHAYCVLSAGEDGNADHGDDQLLALAAGRRPELREPARADGDGPPNVFDAAMNRDVVHGSGRFLIRPPESLGALENSK